jgi:thiamine biosynthesis lipoprotein
MTLTRRELFALDFERPPRNIDRLIRVHRTAMACRVEVALYEEDTAHLNAARAALSEADRVEALLTVFRESSELSRVNRDAAQGAADVDAELFNVLERCQVLHAETDGAFDITSSPLSRCWGFLHREGRVPADVEIEKARALVGMSGVELDRSRRAVRFARPGMQINVNALGKGYALDRMTAVLRAFGVGHALLSAGGSSVVAIGGRYGGWPVDIRSPLVDRARLARVRLRDGALGTSGAGEQFVVEDGRRYGHVIDPRTGWPAQGVLSCSVACQDAATADALSTAFLVGGAELARRYCDEHRGTLALLTLDDGSEKPKIFGRYFGATVEE